MASLRLPIRDVVGFPLLLRRSVLEHRAAGARADDFRLLASWKRGPAPLDGSPLLVSLTQYTPYRLADIFGIWSVADRLGDELVGLDHACGVVTYWQPLRRRVGSLSVWTDERGLEAFVSLPAHRETMRRYRPRGLPLRSAKWRSESFRIGPALAEGQRLLEASREGRVAHPGA
jgi:hypothetical protein